MDTMTEYGPHDVYSRHAPPPNEARKAELEAENGRLKAQLSAFEASDRALTAALKQSRTGNTRLRAVINDLLDSIS
jgi:hypothetical protein